MSPIEDLKDLLRMLERGEITSEEYEVVKRDLLSSGNGPDAVPAAQLGSLPTQANTSQSGPDPLRKERWRVFLSETWWVWAGMAAVGAVLFVTASSLAGLSGETATATRPPTILLLSCDEYLTAYVDIAAVAPEVLGATAQIIEGFASGTVTPEPSIDALRTAASIMDNLGGQLTDLGTPPPEASVSVGFYREGLRGLSRAYGSAANAIETENDALLLSAISQADDATARMEDAEASVQACSDLSH